jgi:TonB family protein
MSIGTSRGHRACRALMIAAVLAAGAERTFAQDVPKLPATEPGELELRANPITLDNPVPALILGAPPIYPGEAMGSGAAGTMVFRITIDDAGTVAEARYLGNDRWAMREVKGHLEAAPMLDSLFLAASENALRGWLYEPPVAAPISLDVEFVFSGAGRSRMVWQLPVDPDSSHPSAPAIVDTTGPSLAATHPEARPINGLAPRRIKNVTPDYPATALLQRLEGSVIVEILIDTAGHVAETRLVRSQAPFDEAAVAAVRQWEFEPTLADGTPTAVTTTVAVVFERPKR